MNSLGHKIHIHFQSHHLVQVKVTYHSKHFLVAFDTGRSYLYRAEKTTRLFPLLVPLKIILRMVNDKCPLKNMLCPVKSLDEPGIFSCHVCLQWKKTEFRTSDFNNIKVGHYWCSWRKNGKRKILLDHAFTF